MIKELANQIAADAGVKLSSVELDAGMPMGCIDIHILSMKSKGMVVNTKINNEELNRASMLTKAKIHNAIERLQIMLKG